MNYALIEHGFVTNLVWLYPGNAAEFPGAVPIDQGRPVALGDAYADGTFTRNGTPVLTPDEAAIVELDNAVIDLTYQNTLLELGVTE